LELLDWSEITSDNNTYNAKIPVEQVNLKVTGITLDPVSGTPGPGHERRSNYKERGW